MQRIQKAWAGASEPRMPMQVPASASAASSPQRSQASPIATVGVDTTGDGRANYTYTGMDRNRDGIPDALQSQVSPPRGGSLGSSLGNSMDSTVRSAPAVAADPAQVF